MRFVKDRRILIAVDSNARSKTWHDVKTNSRGRKREEYQASKQLHVINEESDEFTFHNSRGSSNIDLTITNNNLIAAVNECQISAEESLSNHNCLKYKIGVGGANNHNNDNKCQDMQYIIKENKLHEFDRKLVQEMWKMAINKSIEGGVEELNRYLSTIITTENDLEQHVDILAEAIQSACKRTFQNTNTGKKNSKKKSVPWWMESLTIMWK